MFPTAEIIPAETHFVVTGCVSNFFEYHEKNDDHEKLLLLLKNVDDEPPEEEEEEEEDDEEYSYVDCHRRLF